MDRARAIRIAENWSQGHVCTLREGEAQEYHKFCLAALREQEQREQGCEYCEEDAEGYRTVFGAYSIVNPFHGNNWQIRGGNLRPREIHFCPMCGRKLTEPPKGE